MIMENNEKNTKTKEQLEKIYMEVCSLPADNPYRDKLIWPILLWLKDLSSDMCK